MSSYRLNVYPASYYRSQFDPDQIEIVPFRAAGHYDVIDGQLQLLSTVPGEGPPGTFREEQPREAEITILGPNETEITNAWPNVSLPVTQNEIALAESVVNQMVSLDNEVAQKFDFNESPDDGPRLGYIEISPDRLTMLYSGTSVNWTMEVYFQKDSADHWVYSGCG